MGVVASQVLDTTAGGVAFAVVFGVAVFSSDHFGGKGDHGLVVRVDEGGSHHLEG